jgi:hypothetical protein
MKCRGRISSAVILALLAVAALAIGAWVFLPCFVTPEHQSHPGLRCMANLKQLGLAFAMYADDNHNQLPPPSRWNQAVFKYCGTWKVYKCPSAGSGNTSYALNRLLRHYDTDKMSSERVFLFDSVSGENLCGGPELFPPEPRHNGTNIVLFADQHVRAIEPSDTQSLNWTPGTIRH